MVRIVIRFFEALRLGLEPGEDEECSSIEDSGL